MKRGMLLLFALVLCLSGCAFGTRKPMLTYTTTLPAVSKNNIAVKVLPFKDERTWSKDKIGDVKNAYGMRCADIIPQNNVSEWITDALKKELSNAGYSVSDDSTVSNTIEGAVLEVYTDAYWNYGGRVRLSIALKRGGKMLFHKQYSAEKNCGMQWAATAASFAKTLELTLQDAMQQIIPDINKSLVDKMDLAN